MTHIHDDLLWVLDTVEILSPTLYTLLGDRREVPDGTASESYREAGTTPLVSALVEDLYERLYSRPSPRPLTQSDWLAGRDLLIALSAANAGRGHWESGWSIHRIAEDEQIVVARKGVQFWTLETGVWVQNSPIRAGENCRVRIAKELRSLVPGFYVAIGDEATDVDMTRDGEDPLERYYWHLKVGAAVPFIAMATSLMNESRLPFQVKVLNHPQAYHRADAGVLYSRRLYRSRVEAVIGRIYSTVASGLRSDVPLFTKRLADGLGFAEDPSNSLSFGRHRCQLVAESLWQSFLRGEIDRDRRADALASAFRREGIDPSRPHLGPGSEVRDDPQPLFSTRPGDVKTAEHLRIHAMPKLSSASPESISTLEAALRIGQSLCRQAYWDRTDRLCNWMGRSTGGVADPDGSITPASSALGPDLYAGSAGIALFLAQLHESIGNDEFRRTSHGAIARSIRQLERSPVKPPLSPLSFFSGDLGVTYVAWRIGTLTRSDELFAQAGSMLERVAEALSLPHMLDVIGGNAGAIPALLAMSEAPGLERCRDFAITLGEELVRFDVGRTDSQSQEGVSTTGAESVEPLPSGLSHGAAGIGLALHELYAATGRVEFREAARRTLEFEDTLFDPQQGQWANTRRRSSRLRFESAWCNGAPGIALSRLRAAVLDPDRREDYLAMARTGIAATRAAIEQKLTSPRCDTTPCHGLAGLIEILFIAGQMFDDSSYRDHALASSHALIERHAESHDWPSGLYSGGSNPSLMLGTAGIGYTFLRLHAPEKVPSILWIVP